MIKTKGMTVEDIKDLTGKIRLLFGIDEDEFFPIREILDRLYVKGLIGIQIMDDDDPLFENDTPAVYSSLDNTIYLKESVEEELDEGNYRSNFTLCHEFFHYLEVYVLRFEFEESDECLTIDNPEWQANEFAGQLLIPNGKLKFKAKYLAAHYHTSLECTMYRKLKYHRWLIRRAEG